MKRIALYIGIFCTCLSALAQEKPAETIVFKGVADTAYNGKAMVIYNNQLGLMDSSKVVNGSFVFTIPFKGPSRYMFYSKFEAKKKHGYVPFGVLVATPGVVNFKADMETMANSVITNAPENELFMAFVNEGDEIQAKMRGKLKEKYGEEFMKKLTPKDPMYKEVMSYYNKLDSANDIKEIGRLETFVKAHPASLAAVCLVDRMATGIPSDKLEALYNIMGPKYKSTTYGTDLVKKIEATKITAIGKQAPDFSQADTLGNMVKLSNFKGKYVLLDFWASWCGPCRAENPNVVKAYNKFHDKGFTILSVSLDQPGKKQAWLNAIHQDHLPWTHVSDLQYWNNAVAKLYGIDSIPQNFLISPDGKILAKGLRGDDLEDKLAALLGK